MTDRSLRSFDVPPIKASSTCELIFENCLIPEDRVLGEVGKGYKIAIETLNEGRIGIGAQMIGVSQAALDRAGIFHPEAVARLLAKLRRSGSRTPSNADNMALLGVLSVQLMDHFYVRGQGLPVATPPRLPHWHDLTVGAEPSRGNDA